MKISGFMLRSLYNSLSHPFEYARRVRYLSASSFSGDRSNWHRNSNSFESADDFERRIFGGSGSGSVGSGSNSDPFYRKLDRLEKARGGWRPTRGNDFEDDFRLRGGQRPNGGNNVEEEEDDLDETFNTLSDGMDDKLKEAATHFKVDEDEVRKENFSFRPQHPYKVQEDDIKDCDFRRSFVERPGRWMGEFKVNTEEALRKADFRVKNQNSRRRMEFKVTTEEALRKADFRNVRFLANFITEAGILKKRRQTGISAKAQRKIAREIKTARAFGLMPFTTMGTKPFSFGKSMQNFDGDYEFRVLGVPYTQKQAYGAPMA